MEVDKKIFCLPSINKLSRQNIVTALASYKVPVYGRIEKIIGNLIEAQLPGSCVGDLVEMIPNRKHNLQKSSLKKNENKPDGGEKLILGEVVGFKKNECYIIPLEPPMGITTGCHVRRKSEGHDLYINESILGHVVDPLMRTLSIDHAQRWQSGGKMERIPLEKNAPNPMSRKRITNTVGTGIRAIDSMLTFGEGQRIAVMAGSGVGKSVLMGMIARSSEFDVNVIGLVGERGREVKEFIENDLGLDGLKRSVVVAVTSDHAPNMRIRGAKVATAIAEYFSSKGKKVLLMMDSLTRVAMAQREIGAAMGEAQTTKGYPTSVFTLLPNLLERCGQMGGDHGSITGLYTVLVDGDDFNDPIPDAVRAISDGHINLTRELAQKGHYPAIDIPTSVSRVMKDIVPQWHWNLSQDVRSILGAFQENIDLYQIGAYQPGTNPLFDLSLNLMPHLQNFFRQGIHDSSTMDVALSQLVELIGQVTQNAQN